MKRIRIPLVVALAALALTAGAQTAPSQVITVTGNAESKTAPDMATIRIGVETQAKTAKEAQASTSALANRLIAAALKVVPDRKAYQTSDLSLEPVFTQQTRPAGAPGMMTTEQVITGYRARNVLSVRIDDVSKVGPLVDAVTDAGATNVDSIAFGLKDEKAARRLALGDAVRDARDKADAIAAALGVEIYAAYSVDEGGGPIVRPYEMRAMVGGAGGLGTPVMPGQVTLSASVTIRYLFAKVPARVAP